MNAKEYLLVALNNSGMNWAGAAEKLGWSRQVMSRKIKTGTIRADDFLRLLDCLDVDVTLSDRKTGEVIEAKIVSRPEKVRRVLDGIVYDTSEAVLVSSSDVDDETAEDTELYLDKKSRYFIVHYFDENSAPAIESADSERAYEYISKYGLA